MTRNVCAAEYRIAARLKENISNFIDKEKFYVNLLNSGFNKLLLYNTWASASDCL